MKDTGDGVWPDHHRIVQGCQQVTIARDVPGVRDNLRDNELSLRRSAPICFAAGGGKASHTSAMHVPRIAFTVMLVTGQYVRVAVGIVIDEGDLIADPRAPPASPEARCQGMSCPSGVRRSDVLSIEPEKAPCEVSRPVSITSMTSPLPLLDCLIGARHPRWIGDLGAIAPQEFRIHDRLARALRERGPQHRARP